MTQLVTKLKWAALAALPISFVNIRSAEAIYFGISALFVFILADFVRSVLKRFLISAFEIPFFIIVVATLFQIANLTHPAVSEGSVLLFLTSTFLLSFSSRKRTERMETGIYFLAFFLLVLGARSLIVIHERVFYPLSLLVIGFGFVLLVSPGLPQRKSSQ